MVLDRSFIERADFSPARKGHDPAEVAEHLAAVSEAVEELKRSRPAPAPVASAAADSVRSIVQAAESSAAEIEAGAQRDAERVRAAAQAEATEQVERVRQAAADMLERAEAIENELGSLVHGLAEGLRAGASALSAEVVKLRTGSTLTAGSGAGTQPAAPVSAPVSAEKPPPADTGPDVPPPDVEPEPPAGDEEPAEEPREQAPGGSNGHAPARGSEGARLIALNMALSGTPREQTARYLHENFELDEPEQLLDDVYARAEK